MRASDEEAAPAEARSGAEETGIGAAELAAVPAGSRAVLEKVLGRMELMRAEIAELRADKAGVAALAERVTWLEDMWESSESADAALAQRVAELEQAERRRMQGAEPEPEPEEYVHLIKRTDRHRKQETSAGGDASATEDCYDADDVAMAALNASVALSLSHAQL